jgi:hypothetical protein
MRPDEAGGGAQQLWMQVCFTHHELFLWVGLLSCVQPCLLGGRGSPLWHALTTAAGMHFWSFGGSGS